MGARRAVSLAALILLPLASTCSSTGGAGERSPYPSGSLGPVTPAAVAEAIAGLCAIADATDRDAAATTFFDRSHQTLHVIAAATEVVDRDAAASLLEAKQAVEADLTQPVLPAGFGADVGTLLDATRGAVDAIGLAAPACGA
jgi:hypothetical protein